MSDRRIDYRRLIVPGLVWGAGFTLIMVYSPRTTHVNGMVALGFAALCAGTFLALFALYLEYVRTGNELPDLLKEFFPEYPPVEDYDRLTRSLSGFRRSYSDYLSGGREEPNSSLQDYATQLMWHSTSLQKKRLMKCGLTLDMDSERRAYTSKGGCVRENRYFDGRYQVNDVYEEISALRTFRRGGKIIRRIRDREVAHFTLLSAKQSGGGRILCPSCGNATTRENLLDGCDYCGTRFSVEDMENKVDSFGLRHDFRTSLSKKEAVRQVLYPWTTLAVMLPLVYFGLIGAIAYMPGTNILLRLITGLLAAGLLGLLGWSLREIAVTLAAPLLLLITAMSDSMSRKMIYSRREEEAQERKMAEAVRKTDPLFSLQSFFGGLQNKLSAIHYADSPAEINAFSETDMSALTERYRDVVDVDIRKMTLESCRTEGKLRTAAVDASLCLLEYRGGRIRARNERLKMTMIKAADCRTQAVCGPSVLKCGGCGASLSLMEGKTCRYCGRDLDLKRYDWVIAKYEIV